MQGVIVHGSHAERPDLYADVLAAHLGCVRVVVGSAEVGPAPGVLMITHEPPARDVDALVLSLDEAKWRTGLGDVLFLSDETMSITPAQ